jgi:uncharacterized membrane protein YhaH (DUF805 family)
MRFFEVARAYAKNPISFEGRISRRQYWYSALVAIISMLFASLVAGFLSGSVVLINGGFEREKILKDLEGFSEIIVSFFLISLMSLAVRRLHDVGRSGWWIGGLFFASSLIRPLMDNEPYSIWKLALTPFPLVVSVLVFIWLCERGAVGSNDFGADPLAEIVA